MSKLFDFSSLAMIPSAYKDGRLYSIRPVEQLGSELVTNGDFSSASDWTFSGGGVAISGGKLNFTATTREATQSISVVNTKTYRVSYEVSNFSAGSVRAEIGSSVGVSRTANGIYSEYIVASGANTIQIDAVSVFTGSIDNVSVKEVITANGDFTFSRGSNLAATRVDVNGLIEKGRENLLLQSNQFDTTWGRTGTSVTSGQAGYDGTNNAWLLDKTATGYRFIVQGVTGTGIRTLSVYAKAGTLDVVTLFFRNGTSNDTAQKFNLTSGTLAGTGGVTNFIHSSIEDVGNGWYRCSLTYNHISGSTIRIYPDFSEADAGNIYIQDAQLEAGLVATDYIETTSSTAQAGILEDMPRLDYSGGASCPALLLEPQRTNLLTQSELFSGWSTIQNATITNNNLSSLEGLQNAAKITDDSTSGNHRVFQSVTTSAASHTFSMFLKKGTMTTAFLRFHSSSDIATANVDLDAGTITATAGSATIEDYGNDWYRCSITGTAVAGTSYVYVYMKQLAGYSGSGQDMYLYGAQVEAGSYPTSLIPTYGASVTRSKDVADGAGDADLFNDSQGVLFAEVSFARDRGKTSPFKVDRISLSDGTSNNRILISNTTTANQIQAFIRNSSGTIFNETITITDITANNKIAIRYESGNYALYINGTQEATGTSSNVPSGLNELMFDGPSGNYEFEGEVKQAIYFPTGLTNAELASLTTL